MLRVTTVLTGAAGMPAYNNLYFGGLTAGEAQAAADAARAFWDDFAATLVGTFTANVESDVASVNPATGQTVEVFNTTTLPIAFTAAGDALPNATQGLIRLRTGDFVNGRELRGRIFIPRWPEAASAAGVPMAGSITLMDDAVNALIAAGSAAGDLAVYSTTHRQFSLVTSGNAWTEWAVLRSRRD